MLVSIINGLDYREVTVEAVEEMTGCEPFKLISEEGMNKIREITDLPIDAMGQLCENEETGKKWIEGAYWFTDRATNPATWYLWCDGTWGHGTEDESVPDMRDYDDRQPVSSHKNRRYKGWFINYRELLEAYYLAKRKDGELSAKDYLRIKAILAVEKFVKGN